MLVKKLIRKLCSRIRARFRRMAEYPPIPTVDSKTEEYLRETLAKNPKMREHEAKMREILNLMLEQGVTVDWRTVEYLRSQGSLEN